MMAAVIPMDADSASSLFAAAHRAAVMNSKALDVMTTVVTTIDAGRREAGQDNTVADRRKTETQDATTGKTQHLPRRWNCRSERLRDKSP